MRCWSKYSVPLNAIKYFNLKHLNRKRRRATNAVEISLGRPHMLFKQNMEWINKWVQSHGNVGECSLNTCSTKYWTLFILKLAPSLFQNCLYYPFWCPWVGLTSIQASVEYDWGNKDLLTKSSQRKLDPQERLFCPLTDSNGAPFGLDDDSNAPWNAYKNDEQLSASSCRKVGLKSI